MDDDVVGVGTLNLDNRSLRLNFEVTALVVDQGVATRMQEIYQEDFSQSGELLLEEVEGLSVPFRLGVRAATLLSPIL
jgi:cardiolipin synthase A/B